MHDDLFPEISIAYEMFPYCTKWALPRQRSVSNKILKLNRKLESQKTELIQKAYFICFDFEHIFCLQHSWIFTSKLVNGCLSDQHNVESTLSTDEHVLLTNTILFLMIHNNSNTTKFLLRNNFFVLKGVWNDRFDFEIIKLFQSVSGVKSFTHQI